VSRALALLFFGFASDLMTAAFVMWFLGWGNDSDPRIPAFGYWSCFWITAAATAIIGTALSVHEFGDEL
jgi:hypothetical protein